MAKALRRRMVDELVKKVGVQGSFVLVDAQGMTGNQSVELRRELRAEKAKLSSLKNSVAHHAFEKMGLKPLQEHLTGMNALAYGPDPVALAKRLVEFRKKTERAKVKAGWLEGKPLSADQIDALSKMPGRQELLSILLGTLRAPAQQFVNVVNESVRQMVNVLAAYESKLKETKA